MLEPSGKYLVGHADLADTEAGEHSLGDHLIIEHEIIGAGGEGKLIENLPAPRPIPGMVLAELASHHQILKCGEKPVSDIFIAGHPARERTATKNSRANTAS